MNLRKLDWSGLNIDQHYEIIARIGGGGYADVYSANQFAVTRKPRPVAIKVFCCPAKDRRALENTFDGLKNDIDILIHLSEHENIVSYIDSLFIDNAFVTPDLKIHLHDTDISDVSDCLEIAAFLLIMEHATGGHLGAETFRRAVIDSNNPTTHYLDLFISICSALNAAHSTGIAHRDIKPQNILFFPEQRKVKITDFGIAKYFFDAPFSSSNYILGSPPYMSPESFDETITPPHLRDIYALGCTFFEILTSKQAFSLPAIPANNRDMLSAYKQLHFDAPRPDVYNRNTSSYVTLDLNNLIKEMISVDPERRPTLEGIIGRLEQEKDEFELSIGLEKLGAKDSINIPIELAEPVIDQGFYICPKLRSTVFGQTQYFIFLNLPVRSSTKYKTLFEYLNFFFEDTYSTSEIFGKYDFIISVWSTKEKVEEFCSSLRMELLDEDADLIHVFESEENIYLNSKKGGVKDDISPIDIEIHINDVQKNGDVVKDFCTPWLSGFSMLQQLSFKIIGAHVIQVRMQTPAVVEH